MQVGLYEQDPTRNIMVIILKYVFNNISSEELWASLQCSSNFRNKLKKAETTMSATY